MTAVLFVACPDPVGGHCFAVPAELAWRRLACPSCGAKRAAVFGALLRAEVGCAPKGKHGGEGAEEHFDARGLLGQDWVVGAPSNDPSFVPAVGLVAPER